MSLIHCVVDDTLVQACPLLRDALLQLLHSPCPGLFPVASLMELVSLQTADILNICCECRTTFGVNAEFYAHMLCIKINTGVLFYASSPIIFSRFIITLLAKNSKHLFHVHNK